MKERINLVIIIAALLAFLYIFQKYFSTMWAVILLASLMVLYGIYMQIAYKHRKRKKRKNPTPLNYDFKPLVSIMIPAHNEAVVIENTVENLLKLDYENFEIIVIDDRSEDNTAQKVMELAQKYEKVQAIVRPKDAFPGKSAVLNEALEIAKGEAILVFDADAKVEQNFLTQLVPYLEPSDVGAVQARKVIMNADTNFLTRCQNNEYAFDCHVQVGRDSVKGAVELRGNGELIKREALIDIGGWNNYTITDDLDMSARLQINGWDIRFIPNVCVYEEGITKLLPLIKQRRRWCEGSIRRYLEYFTEILLSEKMSLRTGFDMLVYISEFILPFWIIAEMAIQGLCYLKGYENSILSSIVVFLGIIICAGFSMWYSINKYNKIKALPALKQALETGTYFFLLWTPIVTFIVFKIIFTKKTMDWGKTQHGNQNKTEQKDLVTQK